MKTGYFIKKILMSIPIFFGITFLVYLIASASPGSPLDALLNDPRITQEELARKAVELRIDKPFFMQYKSWLLEFLKGNLGYSFRGKKLVAEMIRERAFASILLAGSALLLSLFSSLSLGILSALKPKSIIDHLCNGLALTLGASPNFFIGMVLIYFLSIKLKLLPSSGMYDASGAKNLGDLLRHMFLPCLVLSLQQTGNWTRLIRNGLTEVLKEDYIKVARAKGFSRREVLLRHGLRNSILPLIAAIGVSIPSLIGGAVVTEKLFSWQGLGSLMIKSISMRDYPVIMGLTSIIAITVLLVNLLFDFLYCILDPRTLRS